MSSDLADNQISDIYDSFSFHSAAAKKGTHVSNRSLMRTALQNNFFLQLQPRSVTSTKKPYENQKKEKPKYVETSHPRYSHTACSNELRPVDEQFFK